MDHPTKSKVSATPQCTCGAYPLPPTQQLPISEESWPEAEYPVITPRPVPYPSPGEATHPTSVPPSCREITTRFGLRGIRVGAELNPAATLLSTWVGSINSVDRWRPVQRRRSLPSFMAVPVCGCGSVVALTALQPSTRATVLYAHALGHFALDGDCRHCLASSLAMVMVSWLRARSQGEDWGTLAELSVRMCECLSEGYTRDEMMRPLSPATLRRSPPESHSCPTSALDWCRPQICSWEYSRTRDLHTAIAAVEPPNFRVFLNKVMEIAAVPPIFPETLMGHINYGLSHYYLMSLDNPEEFGSAHKTMVADIGWCMALETSGTPPPAGPDPVFAHSRDLRSDWTWQIAKTRGLPSRPARSRKHPNAFHYYEWRAVDGFWLLMSACYAPHEPAALISDLRSASPSSGCLVESICSFDRLTRHRSIGTDATYDAFDYDRPPELSLEGASAEFRYICRGGHLPFISTIYPPSGSPTPILTSSGQTSVTRSPRSWPLGLPSGHRPPLACLPLPSVLPGPPLMDVAARATRVAAQHAVVSGHMSWSDGSGECPAKDRVGTEISGLLVRELAPLAQLPPWCWPPAVLLAYLAEPRNEAGRLLMPDSPYEALCDLAAGSAAGNVTAVARPSLIISS